MNMAGSCATGRNVAIDQDAMQGLSAATKIKKT